MKFNSILNRFHSFGGMRLVREYIRIGLFPSILSQFMRTLLGMQSLETSVDLVFLKVDKFLRNKYRTFMFQLIEKYKDEALGNSAPKVWSCWFQGFDSAPELVRICIASRKYFISDKEHVFITLENYSEYISLPQYIEEKFHKGIIPMALFSDLIRLELLIRYGGTWMDSTVLCTGNTYPKSFFDCDLFMFQYLRPKTNAFAGISNWFISARSNHRLLLVLRDMLYQYWKDYDCVLQYFIFHRFFYMIIHEFPETITNMPKGIHPAPALLAKHLTDEYDEKWMSELLAKTCFHKLTYRLSKQAVNNEHTYYAEIVRRFSRML